MAKCISCPTTSDYQNKPFTCYGCKQMGRKAAPKQEPEKKEPATLYYSRAEFITAVDFITDNHPSQWTRVRTQILITKLMRNMLDDSKVDIVSSGGVTLVRDDCDHISITVRPSLGTNLDEVETESISND